MPEVPNYREKQIVETHEGWSAWVSSDIASPPALDYSDCTISSSAIDHRKRRRHYHHNLPVVATPFMKRVERTGLLLVDEAIGSQRSPSGLAISGDANVGKTTVLKYFGRSVHRWLQTEIPDATVPVIYRSMATRSTAKDVAISLAQFLGLPISSSHSRQRISHAVIETMRSAGTQLLIIDDAHRLSFGKKRREESPEYIKYFADQTGVTIVLAGVRLEDTGLFTSSRADQLSARYMLLQLDQYARGNKKQRQHWCSFITAVENTLSLREHEEGSLAELESYLYDRTQGSAGSVSKLISRAAVRAIDSKAERIDREILDAVGLDQTSEIYRSDLTS